MSSGPSFLPVKSSSISPKSLTLQLQSFALFYSWLLLFIQSWLLTKLPRISTSLSWVLAERNLLPGQNLSADTVYYPPDCIICRRGSPQVFPTPMCLPSSRCFGIMFYASMTVTYWTFKSLNQICFTKLSKWQIYSLFFVSLKWPSILLKNVHRSFMRVDYTEWNPH